MNETILAEIVETNEFTRDGSYYTAIPTDYFWYLWNKDKEAMKGLGIKCVKEYGKFVIQVPVALYNSIQRIVYNHTIIPDDLPEIKKATFLKPFQVDHVRILLKAFEKGNILDSSRTGAGKTYCSLAIAIEKDMPVFVITPKSVKNQWRRAVRATGADLLDVMNYEALKFGRSIYFSVDTAKDGKKKFKWHLPENTVIIWDEGHRCKNRGTINSQMMLTAAKQGIPSIVLSATLANNPMHFSALGPLLGMFTPEQFYSWAMTHGMYFKQFRPGMKSSLVFSGSRFHLYNIHKDLYPARGHRISEIAGLPENLITADAVEMDNSSKIQKVYKQMNKELRELQKKKDRDKNDANPLTIRLRARQEVELLKVPTFVEMAEDALEEGNSVIIFVNFLETLKSLQGNLKTDCVIVGGQKEDDRQQHIDNFQSNEERVIIAIIQAGNVGIDLHDTHGGYPRLVLVSPTDRSDDLLQALGRAHRDGARSPVVQRIVFAGGTVEENVCDAVDVKLQNLDIINDGDLSWERLR